MCNFVRQNRRRWRREPQSSSKSFSLETKVFLSKQKFHLPSIVILRRVVVDGAPTAVLSLFLPLFSFCLTFSPSSSVRYVKSLARSADLRFRELGHRFCCLIKAGFSGVATRIVRQESGWGQRLGSRG